MWIASTLGFYSIVQSNNPRQWMVRARSESDLVELIWNAGLKSAIITTPDADYRFRIIVNQKELIKIFLTLESTIEYRNFKGAIHSSPKQQDKGHSYMGIWSIMNRYQEDKYGRPKSIYDDRQEKLF